MLRHVCAAGAEGLTLPSCPAAPFTMQTSLKSPENEHKEIVEQLEQCKASLQKHLYLIGRLDELCRGLRHLEERVREIERKMISDKGGVNR